MQLYGKPAESAALHARTGSLAQCGGVRLVTGKNGAERGMQLLEFRTGSGLCITVLVDRAMGIGQMSNAGRAIGCHSPTGFRDAALHEPKAATGARIAAIARQPDRDYPTLTRHFTPLHGGAERTPKR